MRRARPAFLFIGITLLAQIARATEVCTVTGHRGLSTITGTFPIGDQTVLVTLPAGVVESDSLEVFVESQGPPKTQLH